MTLTRVLTPIYLSCSFDEARLIRHKLNMARNGIDPQTGEALRAQRFLLWDANWFSVQVYPSTQRRSLGCSLCSSPTSQTELPAPASASAASSFMRYLFLSFRYHSGTNDLCRASVLHRPLPQGYLPICRCILNISGVALPELAH